MPLTTPHLPCPAGAWKRYAVWSGILAAFYLLYSLPSSYLHHYAADWQNKEELKWVELQGFGRLQYQGFGGRAERGGVG